jgi:hypothetical protein
MSSLVIGGVSLSRLSDREIRNLFSSAKSVGVYEIDTAPSYGSSEEKIGKNLKNGQWRINSKVLSPVSDVISRREVRTSVENSLRRLRVESINTLFLHSIRASIYTADIHEELYNLKAEGKISKIGYSGDGQDLKSITSVYDFDAFQATLNALDLGNLDFIKSNTSMQSYIKRPLCNNASRIKPKLEMIDFLFRIRGLKSKDSQSYLSRYNALFGSRILSRGSIDKVFSFLLSLQLNSKIIVGVSSVDHLIHLSEMVTEFTQWNQWEINAFVERWNNLATNRAWSSLT